MAEFGIQATTLAAPQGAGANVIAPVKEGVVQGSLIQDIASAKDVITDGIRGIIKANAADAKDTAVNRYVKDQTELNKVFASGFITPQEHQARSATIFSTHANANSSRYIDDIGKAAGLLKGFTEYGKAANAEEEQIKRRDTLKMDAQKAGYPILEGMTRQQEDAVINAYDTKKRVTEQFELQLKVNAEARAQGNYNKDEEKETVRRTSIKLLGDIAGSQLDAARSFTTALKDQVAGGKMTKEDAEIKLNKHFSDLQLAIQSSSASNPELATSYKQLFDEQHKFGMRLLDPKIKKEDLDSELGIIINKQKLIIGSDPTAAKIIALSQTMGPNASVLLSNVPGISQTIAKMLSNDPTKGEFSPQVIGNKEVEKPTFDFVTKNMKTYQSGGFPDQAKAKEEISRTVAHVFKQASQTVGNGVGGAQLSQMAAFISSPEYGAWTKENKPSAAEVKGVSNAFQLIYEPLVMKGIEEKVNQVFVTKPAAVSSVAQGVTSGMGTFVMGKDAPKEWQPETGKLNKANFKVSFDGASVQFETTRTITDPLEARNTAETLSNLKGVTSAVNQMVRIGAHLEGTTDYAQHFEKNKHIYLPSFFSQYKGLEIGQVVDNRQYMGGDAKSPSSWKDLTSGK